MSTLFMVKSDAVDGREDEYNTWYNEVHLPEVLQIEGFQAAQRFALNEQQVQKSQTHGYLAIYEIDTHNVALTLQNLQHATWLNMSDAIDQRHVDISAVSYTHLTLPTTPYV